MVSRYGVPILRVNMVGMMNRLFPGVQVRCPGNPGHGSRFIENNAGEKVVSSLKQKERSGLKGQGVISFQGR